jgi:BolA protein
VSEERRARIEARLRAVLDPVQLEVIDESHLHAGHAGARSGAGHFRALIVASAFQGRSLVERQRLVYAALEAEMGPEIHALALRTLAPEQWTG